MDGAAAAGWSVELHEQKDVSTQQYSERFHMKDCSKPHFAKIPHDTSILWSTTCTSTMLFFSLSPLLQKDTHTLPHLLKGQGTSVFLCHLTPFSFQLVPHSSDGQFPRGQVRCSPPFLSSHPSLAPRDRCVVLWPCSDLLTWGGSQGSPPPPAILFFMHL